MNEGDYAALQTALGNDQEATDAVLQTCMFSFMNRFTDGLRLPSEDEAVRTYNEVYGPHAYQQFPVSLQVAESSMPIAPTFVLNVGAIDFIRLLFNRIILF